jgi:hypothetical protein
MRTTLDIDDEVLMAAKELARRESKTAGQVISELARKAMTLHVPASGAQSVREPEAFYGFRPFPSRGALVTNAQIDRLREAEGV